MSVILYGREGDRMDSIRLVLDNTKSGGDFHLLMGGFLDEFYKAPGETKQQMITEPPSVHGSQCARELLSFAAATAHKLANDNELDVPAWVFDKRCYMSDKPYFGCGAKGDMRLLFMYKSPTEFKHRNLFVDEHVLNRV